MYARGVDDTESYERMTLSKFPHRTKIVITMTTSPDMVGRGPQKGLFSKTLPEANRTQALNSQTQSTITTLAQSAATKSE